MSAREKKLLSLLLGVAFVLVNLGAYKMWYQPRLAKARSSAESLKLQIDTARSRIETVDLYLDEMEWIEKYEPAPTTVQEAQTKLVQLLEREAQRNGLDKKNQRLQGSITDPGLPYHRVMIEFHVNGMETALYRWLDRLHSPNDFRAITVMKMNPQKDDDTRIDCVVVVEQWFVPEQEPLS